MDTDPYTPPEKQVPSTQVSSGSSVGPIIGAIIIIAVLALGGWYFLQTVQERKIDELPLIPGDEVSAEEESWMSRSSGSDDAAEIEAELEAMNMNDFELYMEGDMTAADSQI